MTAVSRHTYKAETEAGTELPVLGGNLTLDSSAIPYVTASITVPFTGALLDELDPRSGSRVKISATRQGHVETLYTPWAEQRRNLFTSPNFATGWAYVGATAVVSAGVSEITVGAVPPTSNFVTPVQTFPFASGERLSAGYEVENVGASSVTLRIAVWNNTTYVYGTPVTIAPGEKKRVLIEGMQYTSGGNLQARLHAVSVLAGAKIRLSKPLAEKSAALGGYFDGSTNPGGDLERTRWLGPANASASVVETRSITGQEWVPESFRVFDLGIRTARPDRAAGTVTLDLASDEALLADHALLDDLSIQSTTAGVTMGLRQLVQTVFNEGIGADLEPGTQDADVTPYFEVTNMLRNPAVVGSTLNWSAAGGCTIAFGASGSSGYVRVIPNSGVTSGAVLAIDSTKFNVPAEPRHWYTFTLAVRAETAGGSGSLGIQFYDRQGALINTATVFDGPIDVATSTMTASAQAPSNAASVAPFFRFASNRVYRLDNGLLYDSTDDTWFVPFFSGGDAEDGYYSYKFEGPSNDSPSVRTPNETFDRSSETMNWRAGQSGLDFLRTVLMPRGFRLVCDEQRKWTLRKDDFRNSGTQTWTYGANLTALDEAISRDDDTWFEGAVYEYDYGSDRPRRVDSHALTANPSKVFHRKIDQPFSGVGRASAIVERAQGMGRRITVTGIPTWTETTDQPLTVNLDDDTTLTGIAASVRFNFDDDTVTVTTRETEDV